MSQKFFRDVREETLYDTVAITATENSTAFTAQNVEVGQFLLTVAGWSGLTSLDVKVQAKDPAGNWYDLGIAFTQATGNTAELINNMNATYGNPIPLGKWIRFVLTVVGTGTCNVTLSFIGKS